MGLFSSGPAKAEEKLLKSEAKVEDKDLKAANDDLAVAQKAEDKYFKQVHDATKEYNKDKAHNDKAALELEKAQKRYSSSSAKLQEAEREVASRKTEHERLKARTKECQQRVAEQKDMMNKHDSARETRKTELSRPSGDDAVDAVPSRSEDLAIMDAGGDGKPSGVRGVTATGDKRYTGDGRVVKDEPVGDQHLDGLGRDGTSGTRGVLGVNKSGNNTANTAGTTSGNYATNPGNNTATGPNANTYGAQAVPNTGTFGPATRTNINNTSTRDNNNTSTLVGAGLAAGGVAGAAGAAALHGNKASGNEAYHSQVDGSSAVRGGQGYGNNASLGAGAAAQTNPNASLGQRAPGACTPTRSGRSNAYFNQNMPGGLGTHTPPAMA
ncbi:uncharacterized protein LOC62_04G006440 [Vanrija pseudolonga]|uniref:Uncharacterized protein n=1 Tax=Vanrija pseudolonga TaxID=143232 RepID=A0AAF1BJ37_9TREE|nr:hypothetical protein LOC62_04G006440 [Vanrija pseudolonga]